MDERVAWGHFTIPQRVFEGDALDDWWQLSGKQGEQKYFIKYKKSTRYIQSINQSIEQTPGFTGLLINQSINATIAAYLIINTVNQSINWLLVHKNEIRNALYFLSCRVLFLDFSREGMVEIVFSYERIQAAAYAAPRQVIMPGYAAIPGMIPQMPYAMPPPGKHFCPLPVAHSTGGGEKANTPPLWWFFLEFFQ